MKYSYKLTINRKFENQLKRASKSNKTIDLSTIILHLTDGSEDGCPIPIDRVTVSKEGKIVCETIVSSDQFQHDHDHGHDHDHDHDHDMDDEGDELIFFDGISVGQEVGIKWLLL